ncbi:DRIM domain-containing protein, partial [Trichostrongylus colubriformis]
RCLSSVSNLLVRIARVIVEEQRTMLFRLLLATAVVIKAAIVHPDTPNYLSRKLRDLRMSLTDRMAEFLSAYPQRPFSAIELKGVMEYVVLPYLSFSKSVRDEPLVVAPLSVIKLLAAVCAYPTHYHILALRFEWNDHRGSLIELMISPLLWAGLTPHMSNIIRRAVLNLLTLADEPIVFADLEYEDVPKEKGRNYGTSLVLSHIKVIIQFLADAVETSMKTFNASNLELLSRLSAYTPDGSLARKMASTILGHLEKKIPKEGTLKKLLDVIACLMSNVVGPEEFLRRIGPFFSKTDNRAAHESLVRIVEGLVANDVVGTDTKGLLKLVVDLESWDRSRIDEPDHDRRHAAYNRLNEIWNSDDVMNVDLLRIFVHTHFNTLSTTKDISLRASSGSNLRALIQYFSKIPYDEAEKLSFLNAELIHVYVIGMRSQNEIVREECVKCLALLADCFPDHPQLKQLLPLRNSDEDVDFFTNIIHIQYHRRQRAIHRLVEQLSAGKVVIGFDVLNKYLIPIVLPYLANTESKLSALSDEGLSLLNYAMGIASWPKYVACLDSWLKHLDKSEENQKATIRVIVAVVEAFHYDVADVGETVSDDGTNETRVVIRDKLNRDVLPRLIKCINGKSAELSVHRKARTAATKYYSEDDDIKRAPVALATVKLLQKVPDSIRSQYLHGYVRHTLRHTL